MIIIISLIRTQKWPIADLQQLDRETRKIMLENGGKHPLGSKALLYLPRKVGGRGLKSVENEYKPTKIKTAVNLYQNQDLTMKVVREFEERATETGHHSLIKDAVKYAKELDLDLKLSELNPTCRIADGNEVSGKPGLEITAGQRTMSGLIWELTGQPFVLPVMLTGHI